MGNLAAYKRDPIAMLLRLRQEHGDVARNRLGPFLTHALAHPEQLQYVLQDNHRNYVRGRFYDNFKLFFGNGLLTTDGDFWRRHRRAVQPMFHKKHINDSTAAVGAAAMGLVERWSRLAPGESIDVVPEMMHLSLAILGKMIFNSDISRHAEEVGPLVRFGLEAMMPQGNLNDFIPRSAPTPFNLRVHRARKGIDRIIAQVIDDHREGRCETSDIISLLLGARHPETGAPMTEREVHDEVMTVFLAGHETTGSGLAWALYAVAQHPSIFRQLREELDARLGGRTPTVADLEDLPYLDKVVNEALRVYPPIWGFTRDLSNDDEIGGFHIPAGSSIFIAPYVTHRHPEFWSNPEAFDPENFAADAPQRHKFAYLPFGGGMRKCIGYQMALLIMRVQIATVVQHLDLALLPGHPVIRGALISLRPLEGIRLVITPRARSAARSQEALLESSGVAKMERRGDGRAACPFDAAEPTPPTEAARKPEPDLGVGGAPPQPALAPKGLPSIDFAASRLSPGSEQGAAGDAPTLRFTWFPVEIDAPPAWPAPELAGKRIVIVNGERSAAERTALLLTRACAHAHVFAPAPGADVAAAASALAQQAGPFDGIVDLGLTAPFSLQGAADWEAPIRRTLGLLHACYADWSVEESASRLFYLAVTRIDGCMGYGSAAEEDEPMDEQPLGGIWAGLAKTLPQELPNCNVRILDLAPDEADAVDQRVVAELYRWGLFEVGYRGGRRYTLQAGRDDLLPQALPLAPGDAVLFSGGARGIGLLCAQAIAEHCGADVIVTGREEPPRGDEPWAILDEAGFKDYAKEQFRLTAPDRSLAEVRREMSRLRRRRELRVVLDDLARRNLPVHYRVCDVTDEAAVRELCAEFGDRLRVIIHNAGVDQPVRLGQKSVESFIGVVRTKVLGFAHLCAAAKECGNLLHFCNVGSLTGRCGGMTGETDYAAANEALARLGLWASRRALKCAVKTLAWPTWDQVGMIANFDVTKRYVSPMTIDEGLRHWLAELSDARSGEVMFMGAAGAAVTPIQIKGFNPIFGLPNLDRLVTRHHHAGEPRHFRPFARLATRYRLDQASARFLHAYRLDDRPALPAALLIEHAVGIGSWVMPEGLLSLELAALTDIAMPLDAAILPSLGEVSVELLSEATGYWRDADWMVDVRCVIAATRQEALRLTLTHRDRPSAAAASTIALSASTFDAAEPHDLPAPRRALWRGHVLRAAEWRRVQDGASSLYIGEAAPAHAADLWALPHPPQLRLPVNHLENALRAAWAEHSGAAEAELTEWRIEAIALGAAPAASARFVVRHGGGRFTIADGDGVIVMELNGLALRAHAADRSAAARDETRPAMAAAI
jgi:cytochrome P450/NAD(P)-dependent dehydrogenase (short-subunit alcohol dehydrogenase family)